MPITGLESKAESALSELRSSDRVVQQVGVVVKDLATAVERLSREVDDLKGYVRDLEGDANRQLEEETRGAMNHSHPTWLCSRHHSNRLRGIGVR